MPQFLPNFPNNPTIFASDLKQWQLNEEVKLAAEDLYMEYHRKILLLSLEYSQPAFAIENHLGQDRMQKEKKWKKYMSNNDSAQQVFHDSKQFNLTGLQPQIDFSLVVSSTDSRNFIFFDQLKEISDAMQIKGILVLASQYKTSHFFFQGRTVIQLVASIHLPPVPREGFYLPQRQTIKLELESILKNKPIKSMKLENTWRLLRGLQKKLIKLEKLEDSKVLSVDGGNQQIQVNTDVVMEPAPLLGDDEGLSDSE
ncbi:uncharacterized protein VP01_4149g4 [Puccinia sorghi]|uniref:Uncharacterized protein n=1 Tax=Puccinia sorghi TaxID=27349 RepID=A0A0L6USZ4_9BASI|nr:uncharacterized protein VP01_4149g4 [Puccinia sorghi]